MLQFVRSASVRLGDRFDALVTALLCKYTSQVKLPPVPVGPLLRQTIFANEFVVQTKGFGVRMARTSAAIASEALLLGTVLPKLVRIAVKYAQQVAAFFSIAVKSTPRARVVRHRPRSAYVAKRYPQREAMCRRPCQCIQKWKCYGAP